LAWIVTLRIIGPVRWIEPDHRAFATEIFECRLALFDQRDDDLAVARHFGAADERVITVKNSGLDHRIAGHFERIMIAIAKQRRRHREHRRILECLDRHARRDPPVQGDLNHIIGRLRYRTDISAIAPFGRASARRLGPIGHPQHLERAGAIGQPAQEFTLL